MTVNGEHLISQVIPLCGGRNVFAQIPLLAPKVDIEAVLAADPEVIVASGMDEARPEWLDDWRGFPQLAAVRRGNLFFVPPDLIQRHGPRILDGARAPVRGARAGARLMIFSVSCPAARARRVGRPSCSARAP